MYTHAANDGATMTVEEREFLNKEQAKDKMKQLMFLVGEDQQAKGILLASITPEILHSVQTVLDSDGKKLLDTQSVRPFEEACSISCRTHDFGSWAGFAYDATVRWWKCG